MYSVTAPANATMVAIAAIDQTARLGFEASGPTAAD
jgi:hypothetical protein